MTRGRSQNGMPTKADYLDFAALTDEDRRTWLALQAADPCLASPYFSPSYASAADAARPGVKVLRFREGVRPVAYWPFRPGPFGTARPVGGPMDDLHGIIAAPDTVLDLGQRDVSRHIGGYAFEATPANQYRHGLGGHLGDGNQVMDLSAGYDAWLEERQADSSNFRREHRKVEALLTASGTEVRHDVRDIAAFERLLDLKQIAYEQSGHFKLFSLDWPRQLLENLMETNAPDARGVLSTLHIDGELAAMAYNMRSETVLHYWFPAYEDKFSKQKPGLALLFSLAKWAAGEGIRELHLGLGDTQYKRQLATWMAPVRGGSLALGAPQKIATAASALSAKLEGNHRLLDVPAKFARKYHRVMLAGNLRA